MKQDKPKPLLFTGITASGTLTIGHYIGVIQHLLNLQEEYQIFIMVADLHAVTTISTNRVPYALKTREIAALLYACGLKKENCKVFVQSQINEHLELNYFLSAYCSTGRILNMIQYKEKSQVPTGANMALLSYPVLMAADILLYGADLVVVGKDQQQHLELATYLAKKFNATNNNCLKLPIFSIAEEGAKIMGLRNPAQKMSKSSNDYLGLLDSDAELEQKIMKAATDSEDRIYYDRRQKPGISNLLTIYSQLTSSRLKDAEKKFAHLSYSEFKKTIITFLKSFIETIRTRFELYNSEIDAILTTNNQLVREIAARHIQVVKKRINL